ncbi:MAG TPA: hypothetical protein PKE64_01305 [Anaerolineae bacterium]|nr:hypothetical protein [Anaerolineae bacterium]HMR62624.1 hypothetical protein [Anaerolineae bacterium]
MIMLFGDQLAAAVASDTSVGWAATLDKINGKITDTVIRYRNGGQPYDANQELIQALGPAVDDELAAGYAARFLDQDYNLPKNRSHTRLTLASRHTAPVFDLESIQAMVRSLGPAIHQPAEM